MDTIVEIWSDSTVLETFVGHKIYINNEHKFIRIEQRNGFSEYDYTKIECDYTHRHYTVYIKE